MQHLSLKKILPIALAIALAGAFVLQAQAAQAPGGPRINEAGHIEVPAQVPGGPALVIVVNQQPPQNRSKAIKVLLAAKEVAHAGFEIGHATFEMAWATGKFCYKAVVLAYVVAKRTFQVTQWATQSLYNWFADEEPRPAHIQPAVAPNNFVVQDNPQNPPAVNPVWEG